MKKLGFIGFGNMAGAIAGGIVKAEYFAAKDIIVSDMDERKLLGAEKQQGFATATSNKEVAANSEILVLAVKPQFLPGVIAEIKNSVPAETIIVSIVGGYSLKMLEETLESSKLAIVRVMPNTPALVLEGASALCPNSNVSELQLQQIKKIFEAVGIVEIIEERLIHAFTAVAGSSPAYIYMLIEAMADAAVLEGLPRDKAYTLAAQSVLGSAKMVLQTGKHPGELKDMVCSPGGITIEAVSSFEEQGFRGTIIKAMRVCADKSKNF